MAGADDQVGPVEVGDQIRADAASGGGYFAAGVEFLGDLELFHAGADEADVCVGAAGSQFDQAVEPFAGLVAADEEQTQFRMFIKSRRLYFGFADLGVVEADCMPDFVLPNYLVGYGLGVYQTAGGLREGEAADEIQNRVLVRAENFSPPDPFFSQSRACQKADEPWRQSRVEVAADNIEFMQIEAFPDSGLPGEPQELAGGNFNVAVRLAGFGGDQVIRFAGLRGDGEFDVLSELAQEGFPVVWRVVKD